MKPPVVLSHFQVKQILKARQEEKTHTSTSLDLGLTSTHVELASDCVILPDRQSLSYESLVRIDKNKTACFIIENNAASKIQIFSELTNRLHTLMPTEHAPTMLLSGIPMHRIKGIDPHADTLQKMRTISPVNGAVLDTATGLGYTAIEAAKTAHHVITIELNPASLQIAQLNPWSQALFDHPKIQQIIGDTFDEIKAFEDGTFSCIIHDPPAFSLAGELYSEAFYRQLQRILKRRGRLFHYIGNLESSSGQRVSKGAIRRLHDAGFGRVLRKPEAFGLLATKA